jgi:2-(1,2-epoxy-1,2-dihydrophenyl)acetyl-CoA isomerase
MTDDVQIEDRGPVRVIAINRPAFRNALEPDVLNALITAFGTAHNARAIVLTGRGGAFCSGADLRHAASNAMELMSDLEGHLGRFQTLLRAVVNASQPVIAAVDGAAYGFGADLAFACDLRVCSNRAYFQEGFIRIGLLPDGGGTWMLPRLVGLSKALELALLGEKLDVNAAERLGLVAKIVTPEELDAAALAMAERIANGPPIAVRHIKRLMHEGMSKTFEQAFTDEGNAQLQCLRSEDFMEGIASFFEKRPGAFKGQ